MATIHFTPALKRFEPGLQPVEVEGDTVAQAMTNLAKIFPGLIDYVLEENGALRKHVNIFVNETFIRDRRNLTDKLKANDKMYIIQALSGG